jgi:hypothetical protein
MYLSQPRFCTYPMPEPGFRSANVALIKYNTHVRTLLVNTIHM